jgi:hypothetical protein
VSVIVKRILTLVARIAWLVMRLETLRLFKRLRRPRYCVTLTIITLYAVFMLTHPDSTGPPPTFTATRPHKPANVAHATPAPTFTSVIIPTAPTPTPTPYNKALNDRVAAVLDKRNVTSSGYNTGGRRTTIESDDGGSATREFSQQDGVTFLDDNTMTGNVKHITPFAPTRPATPTK